MKSLTLFFVLFLSLFITACGGGGESSSSQPTPIANSQPTPIVTGTTEKSISVSWDIPTSKVNGDPISLSEINGFKIYVATNTNFIPSVPYTTISDGTATTFDINNLPSGTYYIYVTTYDVNGDESPYSEYITKTV